MQLNKTAIAFGVVTILIVVIISFYYRTGAVSSKQKQSLSASNTDCDRCLAAHQHDNQGLCACLFNSNCDNMIEKYCSDDVNCKQCFTAHSNDNQALCKCLERGGDKNQNYQCDDMVEHYCRGSNT